MASAEITPEGLNSQQEKFCRLYATDRDFFGNGVEAYQEAYSKKGKKVSYLTAKANASRLLTQANILNRVNELLELTLNDAHVDKQLLLVITQNADFRSKVFAIAEYNKLKSRITDKMDLTSKGDRIVFMPPEILNKHKIKNEKPTRDTKHSGE